MTEKHDWKIVCDESEDADTRCTSRLKVPGGWLYLFEQFVAVSEDSNQSNIALVFVPKP